MSPNRSLCLSAVAIGTLVLPAASLAASAVRPARGATRAALIRALVAQDGTSAGVSGVFVSRSHSNLGLVCQRTPDSGKVSYVFKHRGHSWSYVTDSHSGRSASTLERDLERAC